MRSPLAVIRALWGHREQPEPEPTPPPDRTRIAVLEHQLLGVTPQPGTPEAMAVAQATPVDQAKCPHDRVIETTELGSQRDEGMCERCGVWLVADDDGTWAVSVSKRPEPPAEERR
ncbi:hypothetical protein [Streptomyces nigrescens]|uniref:hypothetical protein n=1 Tax=Streptomyces nigrescens TaxID=1920 RepID=UPI0036F87D1E